MDEILKRYAMLSDALTHINQVIRHLGNCYLQGNCAILPRFVIERLIEQANSTKREILADIDLLASQIQLNFKWGKP
ncbi:MAG: hypothetical protein ACOYN4_18325 [Bacteroidales bacterium]|jgi:hypothetical protein